MNAIPAVRRIWLLAGAALCALPLLAGCESIMPANSRLEADVLEIKNQLNTQASRQESTERMLDSQLNTITQSLDKNQSLNVTTLEELQKRMIEQQNELNKLRGMVEELSINLKNSRMAPPAFGGTPGMLTDPNAAGTTDTGAGPLATGDPAQQALAMATELYNSGQYDKAREAYGQVLGQNPAADLKVEALFGQAESSMALKDLDGAEKSYLDVIRTNKSHAKAWVSLERLADIDIERGNKQRAIERLQYIEKYPRYRDLQRAMDKLKQLRGGAAAGNAPMPQP